MNHRHHIIPKHMGGCDERDNIVSITISEHAEAHRILYEQHGKREDWIAWKGLSGQITKEEVIREKCSMGGKKSQPILRELKICSFYNEEKRKAAAMKGVESSRHLKKAFHDPVIQRELGRRGGPKNKGFIWLTDGVVNIKYSPKQQNQKSVDEFLEDNPTLVRGRTDTHKSVQCPHCGKTGSYGAMMLNHFDNCPLITGKTRTFKMDTITCPHCGKNGAGSGMKRFHFDNCKQRDI